MRFVDNRGAVTDAYPSWMRFFRNARKRVG
jgi:hypothetical protein